MSRAAAELALDLAEPMAEFVTALTDLAWRAEHLRALCDAGRPPKLGDSARQAALRRLVSGKAECGDEELLAMPVAGGRLVHVAACDAAAVGRVVAAMESSRDALWLPLEPGRVVVLVRHLPRRPGEDRGLRTAHRVAALARAASPDVAVGISGSLDQSNGLPVAARDAADAAELAGSGGLIEVSQAWAQLTLARVRRHLPGCLSAAEPLRQLLDYDVAHGTCFSRTLASWLGHDRDTAATAAELVIHPNTLRYRIRRACELVGLDLGDPAQRLVTQLLLS